MPSDINNCILTPAEYNSLLPEQIPQYLIENVQYVALNDPFSGVVDGGTFPANEGEQVRTLVQSRPVMNQSLVRPAFYPWLNNACGTSGPIAQPGNTLFTTTPEYLEGESELLCLSETYDKVRDTLMQYIDTMKKGLFEINRDDTRINLHDLSGMKFVALQNQPLAQMLTGGLNVVGAPYNFANGLPNAYMSWEALLAIMNYIRTVIRNVEYWPGMSGGMFSGICSMEQLEIFRNNAELRQEQLAAIKGSYDDAKDAYWEYAWQKYPYRGIQFGIDEQPLRYNAVNSDNTPAFIDPLIVQQTTFGEQMVTNPNWDDALYEVMFLFTKWPFRKLVPENYTGEGKVVFSPQFFNGELQWVNNPDMGCNRRGDLGQFLYRYVRAWQPVRPHGVVAITYQRCQSSLSLFGCSNIQT